VLEYHGDASGKAIVDVVIGKDGRVKSVNPVDGPHDLQKAAVSAARKMEFRPFLVLGTPVEVKTTWEFYAVVMHRNNR
jgi:TonB family protein